MENNKISPASAVTPFWSRIPKFFLWPMQGGPLMYIGCLSAASIVVEFVPLAGLFAYVAIWFWFFKYAMTMLVYTARGNLDADSAGVESQSGDYRPIKQGAYLFVVFGAIGLVGAMFGVVPALLLVVLITLSIPAAIIIIAIHDSLFDALNPVQVVGVIRGIGAPYLLLCLFLFLLQGGDVAVHEFLGDRIPDIIELPAATFLSMYFLLVMYNMMGYVVYQFHEALGYTVDKSFAAHAAKAPGRVALSPLDQSIADKVAAGDVQGAIDELVDDMRYNSNDIAANQKLHKLYLALGDRDKIIRHAQLLIPLLVKASQAGAALDLFVKMRGLDPAFAPAEVDDILPLAKAAKANRNAPLALELIRGFDKKHPGHKHIPDVYFLAAQILSESHREHEQATRILQTLLARHPNSGVAVEAQVYLDVLQKTAAKAPATARRA